MGMIAVEAQNVGSPFLEATPSSPTRTSSPGLRDEAKPD
jgi:hypothetical protein